MTGRIRIRRETLSDDAIAGLVLGVESVPDGLAAGILAGVNPLSGLYGYMFGTLAGSVTTSSSFMAVQATGAMAVIISDVPAVHTSSDPARALFTLAMVTGLIMVIVGLLKLGSALRFVSNAVMVGFIGAVGVNIVLGQLANFTGYKAAGANRVARAVNTLIHPGQLHLGTVLIGTATIVLIVILERTKLGALGLVVAVVATSAAVAIFHLTDVAILDDLSTIPRSLPVPQAPLLGLVPVLLVPALSLAFVGLVQGAAVSANFPNPDGSYPDASGDFVGQGVANVVSGVFQGMPVGGSMSASALNKVAGAKSRMALVISSVVMTIVILVFAGLVGHIAMPALAGLLIVIGCRTIKPGDLWSVWKTGLVPKVVVTTTFVLTMLIALQYAVLVGVGLSIILHVVRQSNEVTVRRWTFDGHGNTIEGDPPEQLPADESVVLQPYGSLFFAAAPVFEAGLPEVTADSHNSVVILRLRGRTDLDTTFLGVLIRYAESLTAVDSKLAIVSASDRVREQLDQGGVTSMVGQENIYIGDERVGAAVKRANRDALDWIAAHGKGSEDESP
ncbi:MAG: SulP family inorganic anion transporter [Acidimicrobiales bacterium]